MDRSKNSKLRKGIKGLIDKLTVSRSRSRSRSPSQPSHQPDTRALTPAEVPSEAVVSASAAGSVIPQVAIALSRFQSANPDVGPRSESATAVSVVPIVVEPTGERVESTLQATGHDARPTSKYTSEPAQSLFNAPESVTEHREEYEQVTNALSVMNDSMMQYTSCVTLSDSMSNLALLLEREVIQIQKKLTQSDANATLGTWCMANEQLANSRLEGLSPVKQAFYDSSLAMQVRRRACTEGTRTTVLAGLDDWLNDSLTSASIYWMNGMAGTGKTTIAYSFCERAEKRKQLAASFFCTRISVDCRDTSRIIPTIAYQLARYSMPYQSALCQVLAQSPDVGSKNVSRQFEQLLNGPLQKVKDTVPDALVVVIDALDECHDQSGVELVLDILLRHAGQLPLKFLITSRPEPEIYNKMRPHEQLRAVIHLHDIETSLVQADIELYLSEELSFMTPTHTEIDQLAHRSGCLFIYAATLVRYILYGKRVSNPRQRLQSVLSLTTQSTKKHAEIDALYSAVLESALQEAQMEEHETDDIKAVLRTVLVAQEPIDSTTAAVLGGLDDSERVLFALQPLRSVIYQSEETGLISTLHASFPDFLLNPQRSGVFYCDVVQYSQLLTRRCFGVMKSGLRFNICAFETSFMPDVQVDDLQDRIKANITSTLSYACQYWASHLGVANKSGVLLHMLSELLSDRLLFWMEQIGSPVSEDNLVGLIQDSYSFVTYFAGSTISRSTPHIYISCIPFCSRSSHVYKHYWPRTQGLLEIRGNLIDQRDSAALASWKDSQFKPKAFSPDGTQVIGGSGNNVMIRNVYSGALLSAPMTGHTEVICTCAFSADGSRAVSASKDGTICVWNAYSGTLVLGPVQCDTSRIRALGRLEGSLVDFISVPFNQESNHIRSISVSSSGTSTRIAVCFWMASTIYLLDGNTGVFIRGLEGPTSPVTQVAISPDGSLFASASTEVRLWRAQDGTPVFHPYKRDDRSGGNQAIFTPDSTRLVITYSGEIHVLNTSDGSLVSKFPTLKTASSAISPDGTRIVSCSDTIIQVRNIEDGRTLAAFFNTTMADNLTFAPDGTCLVSHSFDGTVAVWSGRQKDLFNDRLDYPVSKFNVIDFSADGTHIVTRDGSSSIVQKWDLHDGSLSMASGRGYFSRRPIHKENLRSPNGLHAVTITIKDSLWKSGTKQVVDTEDNTIILGPWPVDIFSRYLASQFSQDSSQVAIGIHDGTTSLWGLQSREIVAGPFSGHNGPVKHVAMSPDCSLIASVGDGALRIFNVHAPVLDIDCGLDSPRDRDQAYEGWTMQDDGWVVNSSSHLLFCVPLEFKDAWPSPHTSLVFTKPGTMQLPKQTVYLGGAWHRCFSSENK